MELVDCTRIKDVLNADTSKQFRDNITRIHLAELWFGNEESKDQKN